MCDQDLQIETSHVSKNLPQSKKINYQFYCSLPAQPSALLLLHVLVQRMCVVTVHVDLRKHVKLHTIFLRRERLDLSIRTRLLQEESNGLFNKMYCYANMPSNVAPSTKALNIDEDLKKKVALGKRFIVQ